jgi:glycosyltransferase involved in cell wall biosynthesis
VATRIAGIPELVDHGKTGFLLPPGDVASLTKAIRWTLEDNAQRKAMGEMGRDIVDFDFNAAREAGWLSTLIEAYGSGDTSLPKRRGLS